VCKKESGKLLRAIVEPALKNKFALLGCQLRKELFQADFSLFPKFVDLGQYWISTIVIEAAQHHLGDSKGLLFHNEDEYRSVRTECNGFLGLLTTEATSGAISLSLTVRLEVFVPALGFGGGLVFRFHNAKL
jgi:hypothetical protein